MHLKLFQQYLSLKQGSFLSPQLTDIFRPGLKCPQEVVRGYECLKCNICQENQAMMHKYLQKQGICLQCNQEVKQMLRQK
jgi:hypothetical protein